MVAHPCVHALHEYLLAACFSAPYDEHARALMPRNVIPVLPTAHIRLAIAWPCPPHQCSGPTRCALLVGPTRALAWLPVIGVAQHIGAHALNEPLLPAYS